MKIEFVPLSETHFPLLLNWLEKPHVKTWWDRDVHWTNELINQKYSSYVKGYKLVAGVNKPIHAYIIFADAKPIGYFQLYNAYDFPRSKPLIGLPEKMAAFDILIGEESSLNQGIASKALMQFFENNRNRDYVHIFVDSDLSNAAAISLYKKLGFQEIAEHQDTREIWFLKVNARALVAPFIEDMLSKLKIILDFDLNGVYLYGSLTTGDFQYKVSDIDVLVVLKDELTEKQFRSLNEMHYQLLNNFPSWKERIEIAYIACDTLKHIKSGMCKVSIISPGEPFHTKPIGNDWVINAYLIRQTGITLYGPTPKETITEIEKPEFLEAVNKQVIEWKDWIKNTENSVAYQYYAVLTLCRCLYLLKKGEQASKLQAAEWAMQQLPKWKELICHAASAYRNNFEHLDTDPAVSYESVVKFVNEVAAL